MIQKPALKNGQKIIHDATSKRNSAEPQQQQQRKGERSSHVQDVAKSGNGGYNQSASHGDANEHVENGRSKLRNGSNGLVHTPQNGTNGRPNASGQVSARPGPPATGNAVRPQAYNGVNSSAGARPGGANVASGDGKQPVAGPPVQPAVGGGRGRDSSASGGSYPNGGAAAVGNRGAGTESRGADGGWPREARRRGGRGRVGGSGADGAPAEAEAVANVIVAAGGATGGGGHERQQERPGRPRGDRRPRGPPQDATHASDTVAANGTRAAIEHEDAERGGQRGGRPRGRRGRGGQQAGPAEGGGPVDEDQRTALALQPAADGAGQERRFRQSRQKPPRAPHALSQNGMAEDFAAENFQVAPADGKQSAAGKQQRKGREPRLPQQQLGQDQRPRPQGSDGGERDAFEGDRGGARGRGGRRRNGGGSDGGGDSVGGAEASAAGPAGALAEGDGAVGGRRQRPPRPPRQPQQTQEQESAPALEQLLSAAAQQAVGQTPALPASCLHYQLPPAVQGQSVPLVTHSALDPVAQGSAHVSSPPQQPQAPMVPQQQQYPPPPSQDGQPLLDFSQQQQLLHHMLPQHHYPPLEYQQHHFLQQQHQFDPSFQQFQQQLLQQQLASAGAGAHGFMPGPYNTPGAPIGGPAPMPPAFFAPGLNVYGQMLVSPSGPSFGSVQAAPPLPQTGMLPVPPAPQHAPPEDLMASVHQPQLNQQLLDALPAMESVNTQNEERQDLEQQCQLVEEHMPAAAVAAPEPQATAVPIAGEPDAPTAKAAAPASVVSETPASEPVRNEWADRLAQQALARMTAAKSSLLTGSSSLSESLRSADEQPRSRLMTRSTAYSNGSANGSGTYSTSPRGLSFSNGNGSHTNESESWRGYGEPDRRTGGSASGVPAETWRNGSPSNTAPVGDSGSGWRASLAPTGAADAADAWRTRGRTEEAAELQAPVLHRPPPRDESPPPPPGAISTATGRPRLNLQPRTKPLPPPLSGSTTAGADGPAAANGPSVVAAPGTVSAGAANGTRSSIFGAARPREEVLRERGVTETDRVTTGNMAYANGGAGGGSQGVVGRVGGRAGSVASGASDEDQWLTVGKGGRSKPPPPPPSDVGNALLDAASDPFFTGRATTGHGVAIIGRNIPSGRGYGGGGSYGKGSYGSHGAVGGDTYMNAYGTSRGYGNSFGNDDDEPIFKRGLPTRSNALF